MTRVVAVHPIRTHTATLTLAEVRALSTNPNVRDIKGLARVGENAYHVEVRYIEPDPPPRRRRLPVQFTGLGRYLRVMSLILGVPVALFAAGWAVFAVWGSEIAAGFRVAGYAVTAVAVLAVVLWLVSLTTGKCPGLHCPGCGHR